MSSEIENIRKFVKPKWKIKLKNEMQDEHQTDTEFDSEYFNCDVCPFSAKTMEELNDHLAKKHSDMKLDPASKSDSGLLICDYCPKSFDAEEALKTHIRIYHTKTAKNAYKCPHCAYTTHKKSTYDSHLINKHTDSQDIKWNECPFCPFKTKQASNLTTHMKVHEDEFTFKCDSCSYQAKHRAHLERHIQNVHKQEEDIVWYECEQCSYRSKRKSDLTRHLKTKKCLKKHNMHAEETNVKTAEKVNWKRHVKKEH